MKPLLLLALLLPLAVGAQVRKCQIDGKIVYSDSQCGQHGSSVNTTANTVDTSSIRKEAQRQREADDRAAQDNQRANLMANVPQECKFKNARKGDAKGAALSVKAQEECVQNIMNAQQGKPPSMIAYGQWKDHREQTARRQTVCTTTGFMVGNITTGTAVCD